MESECCQTGGDEVCAEQIAASPAALVHWWPLVLGPMTMAWVYVANAAGIGGLVSRGANEDIALLLVGVSLVGFGIQAMVYRSEFQLFMTVLCVAFFCREWHFPGTSKGIYVALVLLAFWAVKRKAPLEAIIGQGHTNVWLWSTFGTYVLSQLIARRVFRYVHLPREAELHVPLEESVETMAHIMMIVTCIIAWRAIAAARRQRV